MNKLMKRYQKKLISVFMIMLVSTLLFNITPIGSFVGAGGYGAVVGGSIGSFAGFPGVMIGGTLGYFIGESEKVDAYAWFVVPIATAIIGSSYGGFKASGGSCNAWNGYEGNNCEVCDDSDLLPCSEYYCASLGLNCQFLNTEQRCIETKENDVTVPSIVECLAKDVDEDQDYIVNGGVNGCEIAGQIPTNSIFAIGFVLDEVAQCKIFSDPGRNFDDPGGEISGGRYTDEHFIIFDIDNLPDEVIEDCNAGDDCTGYIKCQDTSQNKMRSDYFVKFKLKAARDIEKPIIVSTLVDSGAAVPANVDEAKFFMYVDDASGVETCRYSKNVDVDLDSMPEINVFDCENIKDVSRGGI